METGTATCDYYVFISCNFIGFNGENGGVHLLINLSKNIYGKLHILPRIGAER